MGALRLTGQRIYTPVCFGSSGARIARVRTDISDLPSHSTFSSGGRPVN